MDNQEIIPESYFVDNSAKEMASTVSDNPLCLPQNYSSCPYSKEVLAKSIFYYLLKNKHDKIVFSTYVEGLNGFALFFTDDVVKILINKYKVSVDKFLWINGCFPMQSNVNWYKTHVKDYNFVELPIMFANCYEANAATNALKNLDLINGQVLSYDTKEKPFLFFNGIARAHRILMIGEIFARNLHPFTFMSCYDPDIMDQARQAKWVVDKKLYSYRYFRLFYEIETRKDLFPMHLTGNNIHTYSEEDHKLYQRSYISIVSETDFFQTFHYNRTISMNCTFPTEKTFKPIKARHPFIIASRPHFLKHLRAQGYKTFHPHINEFYDDIENDEQRLTAIMAEIERLSKYSDQEWTSFLFHTNHICQYNFDKLISKDPRITLQKIIP